MESKSKLMREVAGNLDTASIMRLDKQVIRNWSPMKNNTPR